MTRLKTFFVAVFAFVCHTAWRPTTATHTAAGNRKIFCYYSTSAQNRQGLGKFVPENIDPDLCTHVIFAFAKVMEKGNLKASNWNDLSTGDSEGLYARTTALKKKNPSLRVLLAVGGWVVGSVPFMAISSSQERRWRFAENVVRYLRTHGFDGIDMDWEFPATRGSPPEDKFRFTALLKELQDSFQEEARQTSNEKLILTVAAAGGSYFIKKAYETAEIPKYVDFLLVMTYNYHGSWNKFVGHHSALHPRSEETGSEREWNQAWTIDFWLRAGAPKEKLIVGIPTYGMSFTLENPAKHDMRAPATGGGKRGQYTQEEGTLAYYEICENLRNGWRRVWSEEQKVPYAFSGDQWVGYDDVDSVAAKASYVRKLGLAGAFIWSVELDDFAGICNQGKYPLLSTIARILRSDDESSAGGFDGGFTRHDNNRNPSREARPRHDALPPATTSPARLSRGHGEARRAFSPHADDHRRAHNFGNYEKASEYDERYGEDSPRHDDRLKAATSYSEQREETPGHKYQGTSRADYGSTAVKRQRPRLGGEGSTPRRAGSSRYYDSRRQDMRQYEDDNAGVSDRWGQVARKDTNNRWDSRKNEAASMTSHPAQSSDFRHKEHRSNDRTAAMTRQGFRCSYPGLYADPSSCAAYFICVRHGGRWFNFRLRCPSGFAYKSSTSGCGRDVSCIH